MGGAGVKIGREFCIDSKIRVKAEEGLLKKAYCRSKANC